MSLPLKRLSARASRVLDLILQGLVEPGDGRKIDNSEGVFMAVHASFLGRVAHGDVFSVAHQFECNGDLVPDPLVELLRGPDGFHALAYENSLCRRTYVRFEADGTIRADRVGQRDLSSFCEMWMANIERQQDLKPRSGKAPSK